MSIDNLDLCPICMDGINCLTKNCVITDCGHKFHANCLIKSISHNLFDCPMCRTSLAEKPNVDTDNETFDDDENEYDDDDYDENEVYDEDEENNTNMLRGFRIFWSNINNIEIEQQDEEEEKIYNELIEKTILPEDLPFANYIVNKLKEHNVTYEQLVSLYLYDNLYDDHYANEIENNNCVKILHKLHSKVDDKITRIFDDYKKNFISLDE